MNTLHRPESAASLRSASGWVGNGARGGLSLIEVIIALSILGLLATTLVSSALLNRRLAEANIYQNTALTVTQGYLEQIKSMEYQHLLDSYDDDSIPLPTKSISVNAETADIEVDDPLFVNTSNTSPENDKEIVIDIRDFGTEAARSVTMAYRIRPTLRNLNQGANAIKAMEVTLDYEYESPETGARKWKQGSIRFVKSYVPTF